MKRFWKVPLFWLAAAFVLAACSAAVGDPIEPANKSAPTPVEQGAEPAKKDLSEGDAPAPIAPTPTQRDFRIITLLPRDAIPAIDNPEYYTVQVANEEYDDKEQVLGVVFDGEARAYSVAKLSRHEIVNDTVGGRAISVTW